MACFWAVITSYSIHYTKLYDAQPDKATKPRPLESQHQALEQAKGLEQQLQQQADAQKQAIQQQIDGPQK